MNQGERIAKKFIESNGYSCRPIDDDPPDFLIENNIAVEVSRLDQKDFRTESRRKDSLETSERAIESAMQEICSSFPTRGNEQSNFVRVYLRRPLGDRMRTIKKNAIKVLYKYLENNINDPNHIPVSKNGNVNLSILPYKLDHEYRFFLEPISDNDVGGFIDYENIRNINHYIAVKEEKIKDKHHLFKEWWLLLIHNMIVLDSPDYNIVFREVEHRGLFNKILIIDKDSKLIWEFKK